MPNTPPVPPIAARPAPPPVICPVMTVGVMAPPPLVQVASGAPPTGQPTALCVRERCGFWVPYYNQGGQVIGGGCAVPVLAQALMETLNTLRPVGVVHASMLAQAQAEAAAQATQATPAAQSRPPPTSVPGPGRRSE